MRGIITLRKKEELFTESDNMILYDSVYDYDILFHIDLDEKYNDVIADDSFLRDSMKLQIILARDDIKQFGRSRYKFLVNNFGKEKELLKNAKFVRLCFDNEDIIEYIKANPILKTKNIILSEEFLYNTELFEQLKNILDSNLENVYFAISGNMDVIKYEDFIATENIINSIVNKIRLFNFSPMEKIMYVYDLVRNRVYNEESNDENFTISRDLTSVLFGDKIVCTGYSNLFYKILRELGIDVYMYDLDGKNNNYGHHRNCIYVKDEKYDIDGVYFFDTTWDSKADEEDDTFLYSYKYFAKTKKFFDKKDLDKNLIDRSIWRLHPDLGNEIRRKLENSDDIIECNKYCSLVNKIFRILNIKKRVRPLLSRITGEEIDYSVLEEDIDKAVDYFYRDIPAETMLKLLYNVRKYQYYENPDSFPFSLNVFYNILINSGFKFKNINPDERLFSFIFDDKSYERKLIKKYTIKYNQENELDKDVERVKVAKILRRVLDKNNK